MAWCLHVTKDAERCMLNTLGAARLLQDTADVVWWLPDTAGVCLSLHVGAALGIGSGSWWSQGSDGGRDLGGGERCLGGAAIVKDCVWIYSGT
mmetsp:Transcript_29387/g.54528  ORF Transcript_29387/g.54528 Transcript_29387/m.54528 type:complete len:93 (+) Transcript_29387:1574-1852(+)